jgi:N-acetylglucosaminyldiphosphoundecaprenol N-acetyl-beta-D-mannosaminyltransferase
MVIPMVTIPHPDGSRLGRLSPQSEPNFAQAPAAVPILGVNVWTADLDCVCSIIESWIIGGRRDYVCVTGAHGLIECRNNDRVRKAHAEAGMVVPDGMPLVFIARRLGYSSASRVYGPELMRRLTQLSAEKGYRQFYYGGPPGLADRLAAALSMRFPRLRVVGTLSPAFRSISAEEDRRDITLINAANPDIVWVGLSTPKQELWMAEHRQQLQAPVLIGVGAAFDFLAGTKPQAPAWMQRSGLEWFYRLMSEPRRLSRRYARVVPTFAALAIWQLIRMRYRRVRVEHGGDPCP